MRERNPTTTHDRLPAAARLDRSAVRFTHEEKRAVFRGMVVGEMEAGLLRYSRRQALLRYAALLGIPEFEACLLIAEAQYHADAIEPVRFDTDATLKTMTHPEAWPVSLRLAFILASAVFIDLLLIYWLLG